jgi:hypothetical protein
MHDDNAGSDRESLESAQDSNEGFGKKKGTPANPEANTSNLCHLNTARTADSSHSSDALIGYDDDHKSGSVGDVVAPHEEIGRHNTSRWRKSSQLIMEVCNDGSDNSEQLAGEKRSLWSKCEKKLLASAEFPMHVIEFRAFEAYGSIPRSDAKLQIPREPWHSVLFVSHRWWDPSSENPSPEDPEMPIKHALIVRAVRQLQQSEESLDLDRTAIWIDFASIEQDCPKQKSAGIKSLLTCSSSHIALSLWNSLK